MKNNIEFIKNRKTVKHFNPDFNIPRPIIKAVVELAQLAPSAWNLQHWRVIAVQDPTMKTQLKRIGHHQSQLEDASVIFIILANLAAHEQLELIYAPLIEEGLMHPDQLEQLRQSVGSRKEPNQAIREEAILNSSLFAMQLVLSAEAYGYQTGIVGGFDKNELGVYFNLPKHLIPILLVAVGEGISPPHTTTRLPLKQILSFHNSDF